MLRTQTQPAIALSIVAKPITLKIMMEHLEKAKAFSLQSQYGGGVRWR